MDQAQGSAKEFTVYGDYQGALTALQDIGGNGCVPGAVNEVTLSCCMRS